MNDNDPVVISALQHYSFCPRQCGLIHLEQCFDDNALTIRGHAAHRRVEREDTRISADIRVEYGLALYSERLGIVGKADVVEFLPDGTPYPIEYKHGKRASKIHDQIQLAAQSLCLEEMTKKTVDNGAIYYFSSRRRIEVPITNELRTATINTIVQVRAMLKSMRLPPPVEDNRCRNCSLVDICQPTIIAQKEKRSLLERNLFSEEER